MKRKASVPASKGGSFGTTTTTATNDEGWGKMHFSDDALIHVAARDFLKRFLDESRDSGVSINDAYSFVIYDPRDVGHVVAMDWFKRLIRIENQTVVDLESGVEKSISTIPEGKIFYEDDSVEDFCNVCFVAFYKGEAGRDQENPRKKEIASVLLCKILKPLKNVPNPLKVPKEARNFSNIFLRGTKEDIPSYGTTPIGKFPESYADGNVFLIASAATRTKHGRLGLNVGLHYLAMRFALENKNSLNLTMVGANYVSDASLSIGLNKFQMQTILSIDHLMGKVEGGIVVGGFKEYLIPEHPQANPIPLEFFPMKEEKKPGSEGAWKALQEEAMYPGDPEGSEVASPLALNPSFMDGVKNSMKSNLDQRKYRFSRILRNIAVHRSDYRVSAYKTKSYEEYLSSGSEVKQRGNYHERLLMRTITSAECYGTFWNTYAGLKDSVFVRAIDMLDKLWIGRDSRVFKFAFPNDSIKSVPLDDISVPLRALKKEGTDRAGGPKHEVLKYKSIFETFTEKKEIVDWSTVYEDILAMVKVNDIENPLLPEGNGVFLKDVLKSPELDTKKLSQSYRLVKYDPKDEIHRQNVSSYFVSLQKLDILDSIARDFEQRNETLTPGKITLDVVKKHVRETGSLGDNSGRFTRLNNPCNLTWLLINESEFPLRQLSDLFPAGTTKNSEKKWNASPVLGMITFRLWYPFHHYCWNPEVKESGVRPPVGSKRIHLMTKITETNKRAYPVRYGRDNHEPSWTFEAKESNELFSFPDEENEKLSAEKNIKLSATEQGAIFLKHLTVLGNYVGSTNVGKHVENRRFFDDALDLHYSRTEYLSKEERTDGSPKVDHRNLLGPVLLVMAMKEILENQEILRTPVMCAQMNYDLFKSCKLENLESLKKIGGMIGHPQALNVVPGLKGLMSLIKTPCGTNNLLNELSKNDTSRNVDYATQRSTWIPDFEDWNIFFPLKEIWEKGDRNFAYLYNYLGECTKTELNTIAIAEEEFVESNFETRLEIRDSEDIRIGNKEKEEVQ